MDSLQELQELSEEVSILHSKFLEYLLVITKDIRSGKLKDEKMCDIGYLLRELENLFDDWRKDCKARKELIGKILAFNVTQASLNGSTETCVRGLLATGTADVKIRAKLPAKGTDEYMAVLKHFGIPETLVQAGVLKLDWDGVSGLATKQAQDGKPMPPGLGETFPEYVTVFKRRSK